MSGIYIHIPFCKQACHYCNFHFSTSRKYKGEMIQAIGKEVDLSQHYLDDTKLQSIYFGGGTPSFMDTEDLLFILDGISLRYQWDAGAEITMEANPDDMEYHKIRSWKQMGINRLSVGVQSFFDEDLTFMNRVHRASEAESAIKRAQDAGFEEISLDLIYGSQPTTMEMWKQNLEMAISLHVDHISAYCLTVEEKTALYHFIKAGKVSDINADKAAHQMDMAIDILESSGYEHYEISNYARNGKYALHNTHYWTGSPYLGIGPSAHSYNGLSRRWNISHNILYMKSIDQNTIPFEEEILTTENKHNEYMMTGLRTRWGIDPMMINTEFRELTIGKINSFIEQGYIEQNQDNHYILTRSGKHMADRLAMELFL